MPPPHLLFLSFLQEQEECLKEDPWGKRKVKLASPFEVPGFCVKASRKPASQLLPCKSGGCGTTCMTTFTADSLSTSSSQHQSSSLSVFNMGTWVSSEGSVCFKDQGSKFCLLGTMSLPAYPKNWFCRKVPSSVNRNAGHSAGWGSPKGLRNRTDSNAVIRKELEKHFPQ